MSSNQLKIMILGDASNAKEAFGQINAAAQQTATAITAATAAAAASFVAIESAVINTSSEFENFQIRLNHVLGSVAEGNRLFQDMTKFASSVPFSFQDIMGAATQMSGVMAGGVDEVNKWMPMIADLAAVSGLSIQQTTEQVVRMYSAGAASADLFRERGITAMLGFQAGVHVSAEDTRKQLIAAFEDPASKFRGAANDLATTWTGTMSMMGDKWTLFQKAIGDAGAFNATKNVLSELLGEINDNADGVDSLAFAISDGLITAMEFGVTGVALFAKGLALLKVPADITRLSLDIVTLNVLKLADGYYAAQQAIKEFSISLYGSNPALDAEMAKLKATRSDLANLIEGVTATGADSLDAVLGSASEIDAKGKQIDAIIQKFFTLIEKARKTQLGVAIGNADQLIKKLTDGTIKSVDRATDAYTTAWRKLNNQGDAGLSKLKELEKAFIAFSNRPEQKPSASTSSSPSASVGDPAGQTPAQIRKAAQDAENQRAQLAALSIEKHRAESLDRLALRKEEINRMKQLGLISATEEIQALKVLSGKTMDIELKAAKAHAKLIKDKPVEYQKAMNKIDAIQRKHDLGMKKMQTKTALEQKKLYDKMFAPVTSAFQKSVNGMIQGTLSFRKAMKQMGQSIVLEFANIAVQGVVDWVEGEALKTAATEGGILTRLGLEEGGAAMSLIISAGTAVKQIMMNAWQVMANVYNAIAAIPIVGPFIAPVAAAGAFAVVAGYASNIASASGGYDIPAGANPMTQLHQQEMVLPAHIANPLRDMVANGSGASGGNTTIVVQAMDARSFKQYLTKNATSLPPALKKLKRNFAS